jgi:hypothetical protein
MNQSRFFASKSKVIGPLKENGGRRIGPELAGANLHPFGQRVLVGQGLRLFGVHCHLPIKL